MCPNVPMCSGFYEFERSVIIFMRLFKYGCNNRRNWDKLNLPLWPYTICDAVYAQQTWIAPMTKITLFQHV